MDAGKHDQMPPPECFRCERPLEFGEVCFDISVHAQQFNADGTISVLGAESEYLVCEQCAEQITAHTIEQPFAELRRHFS